MEGATARDTPPSGGVGERGRRCEWGVTSRGECIAGNVAGVLVGSSSGGSAQAAEAGIAMNPTVGCELQQCSRRRSGESRRGGARPRGRNVISSVARGDRRPGARRRAGSGRIERRTDGGDPRGGDGTRSTDGRHPGRRARTESGEQAATSSDGGDAELAKDPGGQVQWQHGAGRGREGEAARDGGGTPHERDEALGSHREDGNTSNARPATVKVMEGAGKANEPLPCARRGTERGVIRSLDTWEPRTATQPSPAASA